MIWLTWRQLRLGSAVVYAALAAVAVTVAVTGPNLADEYRQSSATFLDWVTAQSKDATVYTVGSLAGYVLPALIGAFWGAPMVARELEAGTHRLVWSQTVTRGQWLAAKLGLGMLAAVSASGVLGLAMTWWAHPIDRAVNASDSSDVSSIFLNPRISPTLFASRGIVPVGYAAIAFVLGVLAGAMIRRTVPAMAVALAAYVVLQIVMPTVVRPHLTAPVDTTTTIAPGSIHGIVGHPPPGGAEKNQDAAGPAAAEIDKLDIGSSHPGGWVLADETVDAHGKKVTSFGAWVLDCLGRPRTDPTKVSTPEQQACYDRLAGDGYRHHLSYQPAGDYWALQWRETGLLLAGAAALAGACRWRVRRLA